MNKGIIGAVLGVVIVAVVAVGAYFLFFSGGPAGPGGPGTGTGTEKTANATLPGGMSAKQAADKIVASATKQGRTMTYGSASIDDGALVMKDVTVTMPATAGTAVTAPIKIGEMRLKKYDYDNPDLPKFAELEYHKLSLAPLLTSPQAQEFLKMAGVEDIVVDIKASYTYDDTNKVLDVSNVEVEADKLAKIKMSMKLGGIDLAKMQAAQAGGKPDPAAMMGMMQTLQIRGILYSHRKVSTRPWRC